MSAPISRNSAFLLAMGAAGILLLGAFAPKDPAASPPATPPPVSNPVIIADEPSEEPSLPEGLSPGLAEIFKLAQAHVDESVILDFIHNSGQTCAPSAEEILYLSDLGLSQRVIRALFKDKPSAPAQRMADGGAGQNILTTVEMPALPHLETRTNLDMFQQALAPYGSWIHSPDYGQVWQPTVETVNPDWRPYVNEGQWVATDNGPYWQSGYSWGWAPFHYGRWAQAPKLGWVWVPGKTWAPAWVSWRLALSYSGWAPLPPGVSLALAGKAGPPPGWYTFVSEENFLSPNIAGFAVGVSVSGSIYAKSLPVNHYPNPSRNFINVGNISATSLASSTVPMQTAATVKRELPKELVERARQKYERTQEDRFQTALTAAPDYADAGLAKFPVRPRHRQRAESIGPAVKIVHATHLQRPPPLFLREAFPSRVPTEPPPVVENRGDAPPRMLAALARVAPQAAK
jgi:hypothetical protein